MLSQDVVLSNRDQRLPQTQSYVNMNVYDFNKKQELLRLSEKGVWLGSSPGRKGCILASPAVHLGTAPGCTNGKGKRSTNLLLSLHRLTTIFHSLHEQVYSILLKALFPAPKTSVRMLPFIKKITSMITI